MKKATKGKSGMRRRGKAVAITVGAVVVAALYLSPLLYGLSMSVKTPEQMADQRQSILPLSPMTINYEGQDLPVLKVPMADGTLRPLAALEKTRAKTTFVDPAAPSAGTIEWEGNWRILEPERKLDPQWNNYTRALEKINFLRLLRNTALYAIVSTIGTVCSSAMVAYGFSRFNFRGKKTGFLIVMASIILPPSVTTIPTYAFFFAIGWVGTWLPLVVPAFFSNAYNVFLLRQFMMGIPREMDEAAKIDGAGPFRVFLSVVVPQAVPGLTAVALFHFFYCWNDFLGPLIYLAGKPELMPITTGLATFANMYSKQNNLIQAAALCACVIPLTVFFLAQKFFMQGVVVTGVDK